MANGIGNMANKNIVSVGNTTNKRFYCQQIDAYTNVCDWYECPYGAACRVVEAFYKYIQVNDDPDNVQEINGRLFYTPRSITDQLLTADARAEVCREWESVQ